jgi:hypothetical protein
VWKHVASDLIIILAIKQENGRQKNIGATIFLLSIFLPSVFLFLIGQERSKLHHQAARLNSFSLENAP